jgi:hypothetical protein|tara:strand:- start:488 stop:688 length:201 start_codon:yes stop_codon:yes gene_type:complete
MNVVNLTAYEVRHFVQPPALKNQDPIAMLNEYIVDQIERAMVKNPTEMREHLVSLHHFLNEKPEVH